MCWYRVGLEKARLGNDVAFGTAVTVLLRLPTAYPRVPGLSPNPALTPAAHSAHPSASSGCLQELGPCLLRTDLHWTPGCPPVGSEPSEGTLSLSSFLLYC